MTNKHLIYVILITAVACCVVYEPAIAQGERISPFIPQFPRIEVIPDTSNAQVDRYLPGEQEPDKKIFNVSAYHLDGVVWGAYAPKAIINRAIYNVGDTLDEAEITKIDKGGVTVIFYDEEYTINTSNPFFEREIEEVSSETLEE